MSLHPLTGHRELRERLRDSVRDRRLPRSLLLHGPEGVGKQRLGLWLGTLLLCEREEPCGDCRSCRLARRLEHPDLHWFFPLPRPKGASGDKLREKLEEARMEALEERRQEPLRPVEHEGATGIYLAAVQEIRGRAHRRPAMGPRSVFVIGDAEAMVPQAASQQAANAFLKLLEEPPGDTFVILTSSRPGALLPTVRSRVSSLRVTPLDTGEVAAFLGDRLDISAERAEEAARRSQGSIGRALRELTEEGSAVRERAAELVAAALSRRPADRLEYAAGLSPSGARGEYTELLSAAGELLRDLLALRMDQPDLAFDPGRARRVVGDRELPSHGLVRAIGHLEEARDEAAGNVNPQAITASLLADLASDLRDR